jgi:DNA-binding NarL/FixJ family response regulator
MLGCDDEYVWALDRAHGRHLAAGDVPPAVRCAFWIGHNMLFRGETARAAGWFGRAQRLLEEAEVDCVECGYLLIPRWLEQMACGDFEGGFATAAEAAAIGERFGDADLVWIARDEQGRALAQQGRLEEAFRLVDEVFVVAEAGVLSPRMTGIVYCNTIGFCRGVYALRRAGDWTAALSRWCEGQRGMVAHNGLCLVHRAEIAQLRGDWDAALGEAREAGERFTRGVLNELACGAAHYRQGEVHRLRGRFASAEASYKSASRCGYEPQPGLALLRFAEGKPGVASSALRRVLGEVAQPLARAGLLPAWVEILLAVGDVEEARRACDELEEIAGRHGSDVIGALAAQSQAAVELVAGRPEHALRGLRSALSVWRDLEAPYEAARVHVLIGLSCRSLGDEETARMELDLARDAFARLDARPDLARVDESLRRRESRDAYGLTARERQVLALVAAGRSNREIARALVISEHTVARHLQNIFGKLGVSSRAAAGAFAAANELV